MTFTASRRLRDKIRQAQDLLGHQVPAGDIAEIVERGLDLLLENVKKKRFAVGRRTKRRAGEGRGKAAKVEATRSDERPKTMSSDERPRTPSSDERSRATEPSASPKQKRRSRYIPAHVRRAVFERDGGRCTYVDERGRRCPETRRLEFDHKDGFARGAGHTVEELRLRCHSHNQGAAEQMYGRELMEEKRAGKVSEPGPAFAYGSGEEQARMLEEAARFGEGGRGIPRLHGTHGGLDLLGAIVGAGADDESAPPSPRRSW